MSGRGGKARSEVGGAFCASTVVQRRLAACDVHKVQHHLARPAPFHHAALITRRATSTLVLHVVRPAEQTAQHGLTAICTTRDDATSHVPSIGRRQTPFRFPACARRCHGRFFHFRLITRYPAKVYSIREWGCCDWSGRSQENCQSLSCPTYRRRRWRSRYK